MKPLFPFAAAAFLALSLQASEPSVFGAGNLDSDEPYGLTDAEKKIVENRKNLQNAKRKSIENSSQLQSLRERIDGLQTIIEGLAEKTQGTKMKVGELEAEQGNAQQRDQKIDALAKAVEAQETNLSALKTLLQTLAAQVDAITADYVSKAEYNRLVNEINAFKRDLSKTLKTVSAPADPYAKLSNKSLAAEAKTKYDKLYFNDAIPMYEELIRRNYKAAFATFMIGEMWHYRKNWSKALSYFKESAGSDAASSYMPRLMLHSAECMMQLGDRANAKKFLESLRAKYPGTQEAVKAGAVLNTL